MEETNGMLLKRKKDKLLIDLELLDKNAVPAAFILNYTGEVIEKIQLNEGYNLLDLMPYNNKNYSIRITNGKNVIVQKI